VTTETASVRRSGPGSRPGATMSIGRLFRDWPLIPLMGLLLVLVVVLELARPGIVNTNWVGVTLRQAIPLALLAACQTLTMLTGGIDLSVGIVASAAAYLAATQSTGQGPEVAMLMALGAAALVGAVNGIGVGIFRVHPLIMTLGVSLVVLGLMNVYQLAMVRAGVVLPSLIVNLGSGTTLGILPTSLLVFIPLALVILLGLRRSGFGRLLFAVGDNPVAARLSGVRAWQVLIALYSLSAVIAAIAGFLVAGLTKTASLTLVEQSVLPSVAAAVIGGTSIMGGRGGYAGTIVGAMILTVLSALITALSLPEAVRQMLFGLIIVAVAAAYSRLTGEA
jgi:ribose transport system permease protein